VEKEVNDTAVWVIVGVVGLGTMAMKAAGPCCWEAGRFRRAMAVVRRWRRSGCADRHTNRWRRSPVRAGRPTGGVAAAAIAPVRAPLLVVVILAAAVTAGIRALS
jgi:hypothetical protein